MTAFSAVTDLYSGRIKNAVLAIGLIPIFAVHFIFHTSFLTTAFAYQSLLIFLLFLFFKMRLMGGGDVKLYGFVAFARPDEVGLYIAVWSIFLAAIFESARIVLVKNLKRGGFYGEKAFDTRGVRMAFYVFLAAVMAFMREGGFLWTG